MRWGLRLLGYLTLAAVLPRITLRFRGQRGKPGGEGRFRGLVSQMFEELLGPVASVVRPTS